ncbi:hypothetical protein ZPAH1_orf00030 [Aeromonas phage ZPAH1]|nr:hypothetical protein ZPAH1_orf00030 [Aeromonas phage ZPAH1]
MKIIQQMRIGVYDPEYDHIVTPKGITITKKDYEFYATKDDKTYCLNDGLHTGEILCIIDEWLASVERTKAARFEGNRQRLEEMFK